MGWRASNGRAGLRAWLVGRMSKSVGVGLVYAANGIYARSVNDTKAPLQLRFAACGAI